MKPTAANITISYPCDPECPYHYPTSSLYNVPHCILYSFNTCYYTLSSY